MHWFSFRRPLITEFQILFVPPFTDVEPLTAADILSFHLCGRQAFPDLGGSEIGFDG